MPISCPNCATLREEVEYLRALVDERRTSSRTLALFHLGLTPQEAILVTYLFRINGRFASYGDMADATNSKSEDPRQLCAVLISRIRRKLGADCIENVWGHGFRLTPLGQARLHETLA